MICWQLSAGFLLGAATLRVVVNVANIVCADGCAVIAVPCSWSLAQIAKSNGLQHWQWPPLVAGSAAAEGCSQWGAAGWPTMSPSHEPPCKTHLKISSRRTLQTYELSQHKEATLGLQKEHSHLQSHFCCSVKASVLGHIYADWLTAMSTGKEV